MSNPPRRNGAKKKALWRRPLVIFAVLIFLVLAGTVIVLSTVKAYFGVDPAAFLTENEVPWRPEDAIALLRDPAPAADASAEASSAKTERAEDFDKILDGDVADEDAPAVTGTATTTESEDDVEWGLDGKGTGGYWMRKDWDGKVQNTHAWDRLYNITTR
jgi:hypothetical protein